MPAGKRPRLRRIVAGVVFWTGLAVTGIIAIPFVILFGIFSFFGKAVDFILKKIDKDQGNTA